MYIRPGRYIPPRQGLAGAINPRPKPWGQWAEQYGQEDSMEEPELIKGPYQVNPQTPSYPNLVPLPRPNGPVDQILAGWNKQPNIGGFGGTQGGYNPMPEDRMVGLISKLRQQFPRMGVAKPPAQQRVAAVQAAQMMALQRMQKYQHQRRATGRGRRPY